MPDFIALKAKLGDWLAVDSGRLADSVRGDCINLAMRDLARLHDLWLNEKTTALAAGAVGQADYGIPTDFSRPHTLKYVNPSSGKWVYLKQKSFEDFQGLYPNIGTAGQVNGKPEHYTQFGSFFQVGPPPDFDGLLLSVNYYSVPADLTDALPTNLFTQYAWEAVFFRALVYASKYLIEDPRLPVWEQGAQQAELKLVIEHARARHSGGPLVIEEPG